MLEEKIAVKHDENKPGFSNVPRLALLEVAKVMSKGKENYGKFNYSGEIDATRLSDALERHLNAYLTGIDLDTSGYHHMAHVAANALMLLDGIITRKVKDDRNIVYKEYNEKLKKRFMKVTAKSFGDYYLNCGLQGITIHTNDKKNQSVSNKYSQEQFYEAVKMIGVLRLYNENTDMSMKEFEDKRQEIMREIQEELAGITDKENGDGSNIAQEESTSTAEVTA